MILLKERKKFNNQKFYTKDEEYNKMKENHRILFCTINVRNQKIHVFMSFLISLKIKRIMGYYRIIFHQTSLEMNVQIYIYMTHKTH